MRIAHVSDVHLGFRRYERAAPSGINQRQADAEAAFSATVTAIIASKPDAVVVAGDLFHSVRPTPATVVFALAQIERLRAGLPGVPIVLIPGNHDSPKMVETGSIFPAFRRFGVDMAITTAQAFAYPALDLRITAVPFPAVAAGVPECPVGERYQVLLIHAGVEGVLPAGLSGDLRPEQLGSDWSYVALGDYHVQHQAFGATWCWTW